MTEVSDTELLERWRAGDEKAGRDLYKRLFPAVSRYFRNKVSVEAESDDLVSTTFLGLLKSRDTFRGESSPKTFVLCIARNKWASWVREQKSARKVIARPDPEDALSAEDLAKSPFSHVAGGREARLLLSALRKLPIELQELLELYYWEELTGPELAAVLELPEGTVRSKLRRARESLERTMTGLASSPEELAGTLSNIDGWARQIREHMGR